MQKGLSSFLNGNPPHFGLTFAHILCNLYNLSQEFIIFLRFSILLSQVLFVCIKVVRNLKLLPFVSIFKVKFDYSISECVCITALLFILLSCRLFFFKAMVQLEVKATQNSRLQSVAARMPAFLLHARANSTVSKYQYEWRRWKSWEFEHFRSHTFPVPLELVSLYLFDRVSVSRSPSSLTSAMYGIRRAHHIAGLLSPTEHLFVKQIVEAAKRLYGKSRQPRKPISVDTLSQIILKFGGPQALLSDLRICFIFLVGFAGFMRCDELIHIQRKHVHVFDTRMEINIPHRKNDQYNHKVYIASSSNDVT